MAKILRNLPPRFKHISITIKKLNMSLTGQLKEAEEVFEESLTSMQHEGKLYLSQKEWDAWFLALPRCLFYI